jgi:hypothetical protein
MTLNKKGFTYIIIVVIIMIFTTMIFLISKNINYTDNKSQTIINNYKNEMNYIVLNNLDENNLDQLNSSFKNYIQTNNYNSKICSIVFDGNNTYYLSNYQDTNYAAINTDETIIILRENVVANIIFGSCTLELGNLKNKYYLEIYNNKEKNIYIQ